MRKTTFFADVVAAADGGNDSTRMVGEGAVCGGSRPQGGRGGRPACGQMGEGGACGGCRRQGGRWGSLRCSAAVRWKRGQPAVAAGRRVEEGAACGGRGGGSLRWPAAARS